MSVGQWLLWGACVGLLAALAVFERQRPARALYVTGVAVDVVVRLGQAFVLEGATKPFAGLARAVYHVEAAAVTLWPFACCAFAWWAFLGSQKAEGPELPLSPLPASAGAPALDAVGPTSAALGFTREGQASRMPAQALPLRNGAGTMTPGPLAVKALFAAWVAFFATMAVLFPLPHGYTRPILHAVYLACAALSALGIMLGWSRHREPLAVTASWLFAGQVAVSLVGPFARKPWEPDGWDVARVGYITLFALLLIRSLRSRKAGGFQ